MTVVRAALASVVVLAIPAAAHAGTLRTKAADLALATTASRRGENVTVGTAGTSAFLETDQTITPGRGTRARCLQTPQRASARSSHAVRRAAVRHQHLVDARQITSLAFRLRRTGSTGGDRITGSVNGDQIKRGRGR